MALFPGLRKATEGKLLNSVSDFVSGLNFDIATHQAAPSTSEFNGVL